MVLCAVGSESVINPGAIVRRLSKPPERTEDLPINQFFSVCAIEALAVAISPWASRFDFERSWFCSIAPLAYRVSGESRSVMRRDRLGRAMMGH